MIDYARLKAPREPFGVLLEPEAGLLRGAAQRGKVGLGRTRILDRSAEALRNQLRARLGLQAPVIVTGHQAEFFHAGVFAKNVASEHLSSACGGSSLFLMVDSDQLRHRELFVPQKTSAGLRRVAVPFTEAPLETACEWLEPQPREHWLDVFTRAASVLDGYDESLLRAFCDGWLADDDPLTFCGAMARGVAAAERELGLDPLRNIRMSELSSAPEFLAFAAHLMLHADDFAGHYNDSQLAYRQRFGIRSALKPVPLLAVSPDRVELPFWINRAAGPRRRLHVAIRNGAVTVYADHEIAGRLPRAGIERCDDVADCWAAQLDGWHVRPRALALSCFARLFLADLFIHGIGGGRYDAMTEDFTRRFFGIDLPPMAVVTATLHLPLPRLGVDRESILAARRASRDVRFNPQRHVNGIPPEVLQERDELVRRSTSLRKTAPGKHAERRDVFTAIRAANDRMIETDPHRPAALDQQVEKLEREAALDLIALDREYFFALHRKSDMLRLIAELRQSLDRAK